MKTVKGESLTIEDVCDVAYKNEEVGLPEDKQFWETMEKSRKFYLYCLITRKKAFLFRKALNFHFN